MQTGAISGGETFQFLYPFVRAVSLVSSQCHCSLQLLVAASLSFLS